MPSNIHSTNSSTLSISSKLIKNCDAIAVYFAKSQIPCSITENRSVVEQGKEFDIEIGCQIKFGNHNPDLIDQTFWDNLKKEFGLSCAYLHVEGKFKGCIYDYLRLSACPS